MSKKPKPPELQRVFFPIRKQKTVISAPSLSLDGRRMINIEKKVLPPSPEKKRMKVLDTIMHDLGGFPQEDVGFNSSEGDFSFPESSTSLPGGIEIPEDFEEREARGKKATRHSDATVPAKLVTPNAPSARLSSLNLYVVEVVQGMEFSVLLASLRVTKRARLVIQLGHPVGVKCKGRLVPRSGFVVVDVEGVQEVTLQYCGCQRSEEVGREWQQLMRFRLFPATVEEPHTAFTFRVLNHFHVLTLKGKVTLYDFYAALESLTDGSGTRDVKDRYEAFIRVIREWRALKLLKRSGIGNQPTRVISDIKPGELAVPCMACPRPGINMPDDFQTISPLSKQFLYHKFISIDACFRLKRRKISSERKDPGLLTGLAYYVPQQDYQPWLKSVGEQKETSTCSGLAAMQQANTKFHRGYATTGAILCLCARHEMVEPNGAVDLNRGERFGLTDYAVGASQRHSDKRLFRILCYDIACQYFKRFFERMERLPAAASISLYQDRWKFAVPKLHIQGHERHCQENFALHFILGAGQTDGEGIERHWANLGPVATSTREMGPGHRRDTLDDHLGSWNWMKTVRLGFLLRKRLWNAYEQLKRQEAELYDFSVGLPDASLERWRSMVEDWEHGRTDKNPYTMKRAGKTEQDVRLQYAEKEAQEQKLGIPSLHEVTPSAFMMLSLDIEELQRSLVLDMEDIDFNTVNQQTDLLDRRARISRGISRLRTLQEVYTPLALGCIAEGGDGEEEDDLGVEKVALMLPSQLPENVRRVESMSSWVKMEVDFRHGQLRSSLDSLCIHLFICTRLHTERALHIRHQQESTRARKRLAQNDRKIEALKRRYRAAWKALEVLVGADNIGWRWLLDSDVRSLDEVDSRAYKNARKVLGKKRRVGEDDDGDQPLIRPGESTKTVSWIWKVVDPEGGTEAMQEAVRVEWQKAWARQKRWKEEIELLKEEMNRTVASLQHEASRWRSFAAVTVDGHSAQGCRAYALRQASIRQDLAVKFKALWAQGAPRKRAKRQVPNPNEIPDLDAEDEREELEEYF
ncbi:hypothetical protein VNI00_018673 [Paramarasmius palmivorus]|uniref:CxC2-like cysteine cluster KDZ transposase-associated domain-containing protein n=1 Tax=Paramarasmius palmivorus TaxID=297713 RepID=A0AAW0AVU5_9AGAR